MAKVLVNDTSLTDIAAAIREKNCTSETYKPSEMSSAIRDIDGFGYGNLGEDLIPTSIDKDGSIYNGCGYKDGYRWSTSNQAESASSTWSITGYIPFEQDDKFVILPIGSIFIIEYVVFFDKDFKQIGYMNFSYSQKAVFKDGKMVSHVPPNTGVAIDFSKIKYVRVVNNINYKGTFHKEL